MRNLIGFLTIVISFAYHVCYAGTISIKGEISGLPNHTIVYVIHNADTLTSTRSEDGKFSLKVTRSSEDGWYFIFLGDQSKNESIRANRYVRLMLDEGNEIRLTSSVSTWPKAKIIGSTSTEEIAEYTSLIANIKSVDSVSEITRRFIAEHNSSYSAFLIKGFKQMNLVQKEAAYGKLSEYVKDNAAARNLKSELLIERASTLIKIGAKLPDFKSKNVDGKDVTLNKLMTKNQLTLIDFWASWCVPCLEELPNIKKVYEKFKGKGFNVVSVSLDTKHKAWIDAIKKENLVWTNLSQLKGRQEYASKLFKLNGIPASVLIDGKGVIVAMSLPGSEIQNSNDDLRGNALLRVVDEFFNKTKK